MVKRDLKYLESTFGATVVRESFDIFEAAASADPKLFHPISDRIYPKSYAPIVFHSGGERSIEPMRYGVFPPVALAKDPKFAAVFNARRDNLASHFWSDAYKKHHGVIAIARFYEWVNVADLLKAGRVKIGEIKAEFDRQTEERKKKILAAGKKYKMTPTESQDPRFRRIIIEFRPEDESDLLVPAIFNMREPIKKWSHSGFAIITDDPPKEIKLAGHDRCPIILAQDDLDLWLDAKNWTDKTLNELLTQKKRVTFTHKLPKAA